MQKYSLTFYITFVLLNMLLYRGKDTRVVISIHGKAKKRMQWGVVLCYNCLGGMVLCMKSLVSCKPLKSLHLLHIHTKPKIMYAMKSLAISMA